MKFTRLLLLLLILCNREYLYSQADSILTLPPEKQVLAFLKWYNADVSHKDSQEAITLLINAEKVFAKKENHLLEAEAWLMQQYYNAWRQTSGEKGAAMMLKAANSTFAKKWSLTQAECWHFAGSCYFKDGFFIPAFEYMRKAQNIFDKQEIEKYPYTLRYADGIATCYFQFGEYREAIRYLKKTMMLPSYWSELIYFPSIHNTLGLCYQQLKQYDSAAIWYHRSYETAAAFKDTFYMGLANGNLGYTYYLQKEYDKALPLLETDYTTSIRAGEIGSATNAAVTLAAVYIKKGQIATAEKYMNLSRPYVYSTGISTAMKNYENLYYISKAKGDFNNMGIYADSLLVYKDSLAAMRDKKAFNQAVLKIETEKHMNEVDQLENKRKHQILLRNSLLAGLVLLTIIALLWVNRQLLKRNKEKELAQQQLVFAEQELINYTQKLKEKTDLLEKLYDEINKENDSSERAAHINRLQEATLLTEDDWKKFRELFEKVYPGFFVRLKEKMPDLSPTDTRLLALTKLQLPPKDMGPMLGVSYDAVRKARQRLRKKINLPEEGGLEELAEMI